MKTRLAALLAALLGAAFLAAPAHAARITPVGPPSPAPRTHITAPGPLRILTLGDSITSLCGDTPPAGYCGPLGSLLDAAAIPHVFISRALGGSNCGYTASNIAGWLATDQPDLVLLDCGTNNVPAAGDPGDVMGSQWRTIVETIHTTPARLGISFIGYSNPRNISVFGANLPVLEANANDTIYRWWAYEVGRGGTWFAGTADFQAMPGDLDYLLADGIHPTPLGYQAMATIWYRSLQATMDWPSLPPSCGMWGYRPGGTAPAFTNCVATS